jgi:chaperonin GroEL (HSP60 family)
VQVGSDIVKRALSYPLKLIAKNAGVNGSVVVEKVGASCRMWPIIWTMCLREIGFRFWTMQALEEDPAQGLWSNTSESIMWF